MPIVDEWQDPDINMGRRVQTNALPPHAYCVLNTARSNAKGENTVSHNVDFRLMLPFLASHLNIPAHL